MIRKKKIDKKPEERFSLCTTTIVGNRYINYEIIHKIVVIFLVPLMVILFQVCCFDASKPGNKSIFKGETSKAILR